MKTHHRKMIGTALMTSTLMLTLLVLSSFLMYEMKLKPEKDNTYIAFSRNLPEGDFKESFSKDEIALEINIAQLIRSRGCGHPFLFIFNGTASPLYDIRYLLKEEPYFSAFQDTIKVVLSADKETPMGFIMDLKEELTKYNPTEIVFTQKNRSISKERYFRNIEEGPPGYLDIEAPRTHVPEGYYDLFRK